MSKTRLIGMESGSGASTLKPAPEKIPCGGYWLVVSGYWCLCFGGKEGNSKVPMVFGFYHTRINGKFFSFQSVHDRTGLTFLR
jgi:hypothetical protein